MKRRRLPPSPRLKRRYNIVHRLRLAGVAVDTDAGAINITGDVALESLSATARRYIRELQGTYHFSLQTYIPCPDEPTPPVKFHRKRATP